MTVGITNAPQGASGGGGGEWTLRTANNDWTDLFEVVSGNIIKAKKEILLINTVYVGELYIPKGEVSPANGFFIPIFDGVTIHNTNIDFYACTIISGVRIAGTYSTFQMRVRNVAFSTDGSTVTLTNSMTTPTIGKSNITVYVKE